LRVTRAGPLVTITSKRGVVTALQNQPVIGLRLMYIDVPSHHHAHECGDRREIASASFAFAPAALPRRHRIRSGHESSGETGRP
jgi:hypothetical protein